MTTEQLRQRAVGAPELAAVDDVLAAVGGELGGGGEARRVGAHLHLGEREGGDLPLGAARQVLLLELGEPNSLSGCGTPIDWWAESSAERLPSQLPSSSITFWYSALVKPRPPYSLGIFMPKAPSLRSASSSAGGYSPVASICDRLRLRAQQLVSAS
jgi:hypothetical protein